MSRMFKTEKEKGAYSVGIFVGLIAGGLGTWAGFNMFPNWCPALVPGSKSSTHFHPSNQSNHEVSRNLKTYLYRCGIWESDSTPFPGGANPTHIEPDVFDLMINGTEPLATSTYGYTLDYRPVPYI
ncbi:hypothetical protein GGR55DRAFT_680619 [Xylaria sp. FL0064]|nr:hypothetical protein GGR55DRAFT_680619 [Xylaria sp. FL0064]